MGLIMGMYWATIGPNNGLDCGHEIAFGPQHGPDGGS